VVSLRVARYGLQVTVEGGGPWADPLTLSPSYLLTFLFSPDWGLRLMRDELSE